MLEKPKSVSKSGLDLIAQSPYHYWYEHLSGEKIKKPDTPAMILGKAIHACVLEPNEFAKKYYLGSGLPRNTKEGKEQYALDQERAGKRIILKADEWDACEAIRDAVWRHPIARVLLDGAVTEKKIEWTCPDTGVNHTGVIDALASNLFLVDLKTATDASPNAFARTVLNYNYDAQHAMYVDGATVALNRKPEGFAFIVVEKEPPFAVAVYVSNADYYARGKEWYQRNALLWKQCVETNTWPSYGNSESIELTMPEWAKIKEVQ